MHVRHRVRTVISYYNKLAVRAPKPIRNSGKSRGLRMRSLISRGREPIVVRTGISGIVDGAGLLLQIRGASSKNLA